MIQLQGAGKRFGHKLLFENCDWLITPEGKNRPGGRQRHREVDSPQDPLRDGVARLRVDQLHQGDQASLSAAGWADALRAHRVRRVHDGVRGSARDGEGAGDAPSQAGRTGSGERGILGSRRPAASHRQRIPESRWLRDRGAGGHGAGRAGIPQGRLGAADGGVFGRLADAHRAGETAARKAEPAAARRADQSPGSGGSQLAGIVSDQLSVRRTC